jgi:cyclopropane fatty-acyl-phospholipid synthase-like methyltransferase
MQKICKALDVPVQVFGDDYFTFVLSEHYEDYLIQWRNKNTDRYDEVERLLGISYSVYRCWEKGLRMSIETFKNIKGWLGL